MKVQQQQNYLSKRRRLRFLPLLRVFNLYPGEFQSIHKGEGENFVDLRPYQLGDDARRIHWPHYAETEELFVIEREVLKNLTIISAIDLSQSMYWSEQKIETVDAFLGILIGSLVWSGSNSLGCLGFSGSIEKYFPPRSGKAHLTRFLKWYLGYNPKDCATNIPLALNFLLKKAKPRSVVFFISDFLEKKDFNRTLRAATRTFDLVPVVIKDPKEFVLLPGTRIDYKDMETGKTETVWLTRERIDRIAAEKTEREQALKSLFKHYGLEPITLESPDTKKTVKAVHNFFIRRLNLIKMI